MIWVGVGRKEGAKSPSPCEATHIQMRMHLVSLRTASEGPYNSQEEGRKMARLNPPLHGRRSHTHTTQGGRGGGEQAAGSWSGSSYSGRNRGVALSSLLQGCADVGAIDGEMPRVKGGMLPLPCFRSPPGGSGRLHAGRRLQSRPSGVPRNRAHVSGVDSDQPGADGVRVRSFALRALSSSAGILKRATSFRAFRAFASTGSFSGAAGNDRRHFRGVAPQ